ncbi:hypothetical protein V8E55_007632 [Tylopilus felleus]
MSIMTTRRRSSHATGSQKNHSSSTFTLHDPHLNDTSTSFTARPLPVASSIELMQSSTYPLHLVQQSTNRHPQTRFTLHQILTVAISIAFVTPKFIEVFRGRPLTLSFLDLILAILQLTLYVCSWYESDPPPSLRWLHDTDWDYLPDISNQFTATIKNNMSEIWCTLILALCILLPISKANLLMQSGQAADLIGVFTHECFLGGTAS